MTLKREKMTTQEPWTPIFRNELGYDGEGFKNGYDQFGFGRDGYNFYGWDAGGFNKEGIHFTDANLPPHERRERQILYGDDMSPRYGADGYNKRGYDQFGYDREGFYIDGFNRKGLNRKGRDRNGRDRDGLTFEERKYLEETYPEELDVYRKKLREIEGEKIGKNREFEGENNLTEPALEFIASALVSRGFQFVIKEIFRAAREISEEKASQNGPRRTSRHAIDF